MNRFVLSVEEVGLLRGLLAEITSTCDRIDDSSFLTDVTVWAHELPRRLRAALTNFRVGENSAVFLVSGYPLNDAHVGPTPSRVNDPAASRRTISEEVLFLLCGSLLGDAIGWGTQHGGHIVHDVLPIRGHEQEQIGTGCEQRIWWHTEDAFHEMRGDYVGLMCLRNPDGVATTICPLESVPLQADQVRLLSQPLFTIRPDESHQRKNAPENTESDSAFSRIEEMNRTPAKIAILSGAPDAPYIRIDPYFMDPIKESDARSAFESLTRAIDERMCDIVLTPGDICFIDNFRAVHGRKSFKARFDGTDRWLKRVNITRDLRKSRAHRRSSVSRVIS